MGLSRSGAVLAASLLLGAATHAQEPVATPAAPTSIGVSTPQPCETLPLHPADGRGLARRAECVLSGALPSPDRIAETRALAKAAMEAGEPSGGLMLFLAFTADPANQYMRDGTFDEQAYRQLGARTLAQRQAQIEALEGLGWAAGRSHRAASLLALAYFHDTVAPGNILRTGAMADLLKQRSEHQPIVERYAREADLVGRAAGATKTSMRSFFQTYQKAEATARDAYQSLAASDKRCEKPQLKSLSSSEISDGEYLPLQGTVMKDSYLVRGQWTEFWAFAACGEEIPLKISFAADGWGGVTSTVTFNKGD